MRLVAKIAAVLVVGTALGLFATWFVVTHGLEPIVADGPWRTNLTVGDTRTDPYTRASVALHGLFALKRSETLYYEAKTDDDGHPLDGHCRYEIAGRDPDARWWSITAYGADDFLIPNPAHRYSVAKTQIARLADGSYIVRVSAQTEAGNWIPVASGPFSLALRLYNPGVTVTFDPAHAALPSIKMAGCS